MVKQIVRDTAFLKIKSEKAVPEDKQIAIDLKDTLTANKAGCVGMAANMIGVSKNIIIVTIDDENVIMYNPKIVKKLSPFKTEEGCLSLEGRRKTTRYKDIVVEYMDEDFNNKKEKFSGWTAQIIQHECDHLQGIII